MSLVTAATTGRLRVLMTAPLYLPHVGGVERYVHMLSRRLAERGISVTVLTTDPAGAWPPTARLDGVDVVRVPAWPRGRDYYFAPQVYDFVRRGDWDVVHVQCYHSFVAPLAMLGAVHARTPYVVTFHAGGHSSWLRRRLRRPQWAALRPLLARADRLIAIAPFEIDLYGALLKVPRERFALIPTGIGLGNNDPPAAFDGATAPVIASIGRLERYKGHHRLIEALPAILRVRPDARVWIAGAGPYEEPLRRMARRLGVEDRVEIRAVPGHDPMAMADALSKVALVVLFSDRETLPLAVLEALAVGRPVLVTYNPGLRELADRGLVRAVAGDSGPGEIAPAVLEQLEDPFVPAQLDLPTWEDCANQHLELYGAVVDAATRPVGSAR